MRHTVVFKVPSSVVREDDGIIFIGDEVAGLERGGRIKP